MSTKRRAWILSVIAMGASAVLVRASMQRAAGARAALAAEGHRHERLAQSAAENAKLRSEQPSVAQLRELEGRKAHAEALRSRISSLGRQVSAAHSPAPVDGGVASGDWSYAGNATPKAALMSVLWSASRGDVDQLASLLAFDTAAREKADAMYASLPLGAQQDYGSPERVVATLLSGSFPKDASSAELGDEEVSGDDASITMSVSHTGAARNNTYKLDHSAGGWRLLVPSEVLDGYGQLLQGLPADAKTDGQ